MKFPIIVTVVRYCVYRQLYNATLMLLNAVKMLLRSWDVLLCPLAQDRHQKCSEDHAAYGREHQSYWCFLHVATEHELVSHQFHKTGVDENAGRDRVEDTVDDEEGLAVRVERSTDAETNSNGNGR